MPDRESARKFLVYDRQKKSLTEETVFGSSQMNFAYHTKFGRGLSSLLLKRKFVSRLGSLYYKSGFSRRDILPFIQKFKINTEEFRQPAETFRTFNDFFTRKIKPEARPVDFTDNSLIAPCDSRLLVHRIEENTVISAKGQLYTLPQLLCDTEQAAAYRDGLCLVFRLCPTDYHRFAFIDEGSWSSVVKIKGAYHSVNTFFVSGGVHATNYREKTVLHTKNFGDVLQMEVGAMMIGKIVQTAPCPGTFTRGEEKGYFEYGASTVILLIKKGMAVLDADIAEQSAAGTECLVRLGEKIGQAMQS